MIAKILSTTSVPDNYLEIFYAKVTHLCLVMCVDKVDANKLNLAQASHQNT